MTPVIRRRLSVRGRVQGVGFRPYVYRLARGLGLAGLVGNDTHGAFIEVQGSGEAVDAFGRRLGPEAPPLARVAEVLATDLPAVPADHEFRIQSSRADGVQDAEVTPDSALCADCLRELFDTADRRYRYPFINCTNCGPRYSIIRRVPYDRPNTTMAAFTMCPACQAEYDDPANRRFHAQPNACPVCGPRAWLVDRAGRPTEGVDPIRACAELLNAGRIVAVKGLGGFHLACRADSDDAVGELRRRKGRESKPLAVMVAGLVAARGLVELDEAAAELLSGPVRPIVLLPRLPDALVSPQVARGTNLLGLMLPYTPLHELLLADVLGSLVMTSGNPTAEPLCRDNDEALSRLSELADAFLLHDRDIERRVDDSVVRKVIGDRLQVIAGKKVIGDRLQGVAEKKQPPDEHLPLSTVTYNLSPITYHLSPILRRARGYSPAPIEVPIEAAEPILAVGGELKSSVCILAGHTAVLSEHLGELDNPAAYRNFVATVEQFQQFLDVTPKVIACDLHPEYAATRFARRYAENRGLRLVEAQHHHAHVVGAAAENGFGGPIVGIACDGTGYGSDGAIWGGEVLVGDARGFRRAAHIEYYPLAGGDAAARETWRPAAALVRQAYGAGWRGLFGRLAVPDECDAEALDLVTARLEGGARLPMTSSTGRLFDAAAWMLGLCGANTHEGRAAMALEAAAESVEQEEPLTWATQRGDDAIPARNADSGLDVRPLVRRLVEGRLAGEPVPALARLFHVALAAMFVDAATLTARAERIEHVALSGGCFANRLLLEGMTRRLAAAGLSVLTHRQAPPGDGGLALGQAVVAAGTVGSRQ